ncbi:lipoprotein [Urechidicola croceus]|uniref:GOLD domain-containing protein n=1 Tax=Urechidicola croceus TaxID=1850246 RepID=A0A1D8P907_9FLAO|nr:lipoprotein [Urechidicola croceus]AOW21035.1 hypothetical protein LPB138_10240 [Urechidicola croceus]
MKRYILILVAILSLSSCSLDDDSDSLSFYPTLVAIDDAVVPEEFQLGESYEITIDYTLPNACYSFNDIYYEYDQNTRIVAVRVLVTNDTSCTQATIEEQYTFTVQVTQTEPYVFKFWQGEDNQGNNQYLIVEVPVVE